MADLRGLTGKKVRCGIKNGMTMDDFCKRYECTPEEMGIRIGHLFTVKGAAKQVLSEIAANSKKPRSKTKPEEETAPVAEVATEEPEEEPKEEDLKVLSLEALKALEASKSRAVISMEAKYVDLHRERVEGRKAFAEVLDKIKEIKQQFDAANRRAREIIRNDNALVEQMNEITVTYSAERKALEMIRAKIEEMSKIVICVYSSREIGPLDETEIELDDSGHEDHFELLREQEEAEDFRPRDLRVVARVIAIVDKLDVPFEIVFEDDEVRRAYEIFGTK